MKKLLLLLIVILTIGCSKDNNTDNSMVTVEYHIENGNLDGKIGINKEGTRSTEQIATGPNYKLTRRVPKDEWYYLSYTTTQKVPDNFKIYVVFDGKKDENVIKGSANWGYTFTLSR